ncbi:PTS sugar transporter subunit IIC [Colwellia psychrerythraea]|uniref:Perfringolysin O regulator protein n=1 Tax=Colwellia psychrerythraea (strain 34H / ATCC BAA-681) TaxID=167879 RepID=Q484B7_COLP3|nr:PTS sugar transporter subunit IIC [Colwellia psychrerythraea]AAZ28014.1 perfringolysin O regulator protein [Colwellia psychrerythraea 34H]
MELLKGITLLLAALTAFSLFSRFAPYGTKAMGGLASAAVASFLVEAIHAYISGDFLGIDFLRETGLAAGSMGGPAAAALVALALGANPVFAIVAAIATKGTGILAGFIAGYICYFISKVIEKHLPEGIDVIVGALILAPCAYIIAHASGPVVGSIMAIIGSAITGATSASPYVMGFLLGGLIKMICTSPLSSMALTAILGLTGLPMGIAAIACVGGSFTNGILMKRLKLGDRNKVIAIMLEPLTQADIVTRNAFKIYSCNFFGGALSGLVAVYFNIINDAPGTAAPIPGLLAPFAFNEASTVLMAVLAASICGIAAGYVGSSIHLKLDEKRANKLSGVTPVTT